MLPIFFAVLERTTSVYISAGLVIEILLVISTIEFMRKKPWEGREQKVD